jgi:heme/copper-type cytochrome/quinol oxidase subunit 4
MNKEKTKTYLLVFAIILQLITLLTPYWSSEGNYTVLNKKGEKLSSNVHFGLYSMCSSVHQENDDVKTCISIPTDQNDNFPKTELYVCRTLVLLSLILTVTSLYKKQFLYGAILINIVLLILWPIYFLKIKDSSNDSVSFSLGYSYYISMVSCASLILIPVLDITMKNSSY